MAMFIAWQNLTQVSPAIAKETISMIGKDSEVTFQEDWRQKAVSARKDWLCIWRNMFGDTIIEMIVFNDRKNSFLNHLKGVMFSGSFTTLPMQIIRR